MTTTEQGILVPTSAAAALELAGALGAQLTATGLDLTDPSLPYESWENLGRCIGFAGNAWQWWAGDWMNIGETLYGQLAAQASDDQATRYDHVRRTLGKEQQTILNIASVCRNVKRGVRRVEIGFSHHACVAPFHDDPELQSEWLARAIENQWTIAEFREAIRNASLPEPEDPEGAGQVVVPPMTRCEQIELAAANVYAVGQSTTEGHVLVSPEAWAQLATALGH